MRATKSISACLFAIAALAFTPQSFAEGEPCSSDSECASEEVCMMTPCAAPDCDPDDPDCEADCPAEGVCALDRDSRFSECETDADCDGSHVCEEVGGTGCATPGCPPGDDCPEPPPCEPEVIRACVPPPPDSCDADADCEDGLVCVFVEEGGDCLVDRAPCPSDEECPEPTDEECESETVGYCLPPYFAPCEAAADCGPGFECVDEEICSCSGGGGSSGGGSTDPVPDDGADAGSGDDGGSDEEGGSDDGDDRSGDDDHSRGDDDGHSHDDCSCEPTGDRYCQIIEVECSSDDDCEADLECKTFEDGASGTCTFDPDSGEEECTETEPSSVSYCVPADFERWFDDGGAPAVPGVGRGSEDSSDGEPTSGDGGGGGSAGGEDLDESAGSADSRSDSGGCAVAGTSGSAPWLLLAVVALAARRRRR